MAHFVAVEAYSHEVVVVVSGLAVTRLMNQFSMPMPILNLKDLRIILSNHQTRSTMKEWENSFFHMILFEDPIHLTKYYCLSYRAVMKQQQYVLTGIVIL
jgi:hypothetical protein